MGRVSYFGTHKVNAQIILKGLRMNLPPVGFFYLCCSYSELDNAQGFRMNIGINKGC